MPWQCGHLRPDGSTRPKLVETTGAWSEPRPPCGASAASAEPKASGGRGASVPFGARAAFECATPTGCKAPTLPWSGRVVRGCRSESSGRTARSGSGTHTRQRADTDVRAGSSSESAAARRCRRGTARKAKSRNAPASACVRVSARACGSERVRTAPEGLQGGTGPPGGGGVRRAGGSPYPPFAFGGEDVVVPAGRMDSPIWCVDAEALKPKHRTCADWTRLRAGTEAGA